MSDRRKHIPLKVQLHAALRQLGFEPHEVQLDHDPALILRPYDEAIGDTVPAANDPAYLVWRPTAEHRNKTFGPGGERRITTAGGDIHTARKLDRLSEAQVEFQRRLTAPTPREERPKSKWPKRPFPNRKKGIA